MSYQSALYLSRTSHDVLQLAERDPSPAGCVQLLLRLVALTPQAGGEGLAAQAAAVRADPRLAGVVSRAMGGTDELSAAATCRLVWTLAMLRRPVQQGEGSMQELRALLDSRPLELEPLAAAEACWAWKSLGRDGHDGRVAEGGEATPLPVSLAHSAATLPFAVHLGVRREILELRDLCLKLMATALRVDGALTHHSFRGQVCVDCLGGVDESLGLLFRETGPVRDTIRSGSREPSERQVWSAIPLCLVPHPVGDFCHVPIRIPTLISIRPSSRPLNSIPQLDPSTRSLNSIPQLDPSTRSLSRSPPPSQSSRLLVLHPYPLTDSRDSAHCLAVECRIPLQLLRQGDDATNRWLHAADQSGAKQGRRAP